ncbi:hypothetical protein [Streptomyces davaonensis]|uniref:hypothetical protein n=1 Tax=Streptomyces davaonensis TaxID=348043 RepID=UPI0012FF9BFE|nr:hypothetical protein [Streptomyces davaonensis]
MAELGERILAEFGDEHTNNTLVRWLAHHTARLVTEADQAREGNAPDAAARAAEARDAILRLWQARSSWPSGWPPPYAAKLAATLDALPEPGNDRWSRPTVQTRLHEIHHNVLAILVDLTTDDRPEAEEDWLNRFGPHLTEEESAVLRYAAHLPRRAAALQKRDEGETSADADVDVDRSGTAAVIEVLAELAEAYRNTITELLRAVVEAATSPDEDADGDGESV